MNYSPDNLDLLKHIENLTQKVNELMRMRSQSAIRRYPLTFTLLALFGVAMVSEGIKGILEQIVVLQDRPYFLLVGGIAILTVLGSVFRKLDK